MFYLGLYSCLENAFCAKSLIATSFNDRPKCKLLLSASFDFMLFYPFRTVLSYMLRKKNLKATGGGGGQQIVCKCRLSCTGVAGFCWFGVFFSVLLKNHTRGTGISIPG